MTASRTPRVPSLDDRPLLALGLPTRAVDACLCLGIKTVSQFLETPRDALLRTPGFGRRSYERILERIRLLTPVRSAADLLLPPALLDLPIAEIGVGEQTKKQLLGLGCETVRQAIALDARLFDAGGGPGPAAASDVRAALARILGAGLERAETGCPEDLSYAAIERMLLAPLADSQRKLFQSLIGFDCVACTPAELIARTRSDPATFRHEIASIRQVLERRLPALLARIRSEMLAELAAFDGIVRGDRLAASTIGRTLAAGSGDLVLPLRLAAFCFPADFHLVDTALAGIPPARFRGLVRRLKQITSLERLPCSLARISELLGPSLGRVPKGLLCHVIQRILRLSIVFDERKGEVVRQGSRSMAARLAEILKEEGRPLPALDLAFFYRERYRRVRLPRVREALRKDPLFVEIARDEWSLREREKQRLSEVEPLARRIAAHAVDAGGKLGVADILAEQGADDATFFLVMDHLRRDPTVRYLGRGQICPATQQRSQVLSQILRDFRRAAGEVVLSRFVANQPPEKRRLVERLLRENRLFLLSAEDRIDVLSNHPFNDERLRRLLDLTERHLRARGGYGTLASLLAVVKETDLGGDWMNERLLGELLRRHGSFEILPAGIVAVRDLGLIGWLQAKARHALRKAGVALSVHEILVEKPELSEFASSLEEILGQDPTLARDEAGSFRLP
ncbi:MAG: hypothetical protein Fur0037_13230 [Planctomycetota bacterium]